MLVFSSETNFLFPINNIIDDTKKIIGENPRGRIKTRQAIPYPIFTIDEVLKLIIKSAILIIPITISAIYRKPTKKLRKDVVDAVIFNDKITGFLK